MKNISKAATRETLQVDCDIHTGEIMLEGISYPQDAAEFFEPISEWLENYISEIANPVVLNVKVSYLNSSSTKFLFELIDKMEDYFSAGGDARVNWYYAEDDEDIEEAGEEFKEDMKLPFELISFQ
ncbi:MAG: DUF1987 domain-containing protein [Gammaproteobacteria bacterium]|nr:MAG: DUF1987 domain-containing protein [Gammaproteobacteria bacterium]